MMRSAWRRAGLALAATAAIFGAFLAWQWPFTVNFARALLPREVVVQPDATARAPVLERVDGAPAPLPGDGPTQDSPFGAALDYATRMQSWSLLVWHDGRLRVEHYANGATRDTRSESASMHKSVMAIAYGCALADGVIRSLDDPIGRYLHEWADDPRGRITVRQGLQMATGLSNASTRGGLFSERSRFQFGLFPERILLSQHLVRAPGSAFEYTNVNNNLMGLVLQRALRERYSEYLSRRLWRPIGASDAYVVPDRPGGYVRTASSLLATPRDWLRIGILLAGDGVFAGQRVIPAGWVDAMATSSPGYANYGLQLWLASPYAPRRFYNGFDVAPFVPAAEPFLAPDTVYFDGWGGQRVYVSRAERLVIVHTGPERLDWDDAALPNLVIRALRAESPVAGNAAR